MKPGSLVAGRFEIVRHAASGGMGAVYEALDRVSGQAVALKVLHTPVGERESRLVREAEVLAELRHPAIVGHVAHGATPQGVFYLAMEWIAGETLSQKLARGPLSVPEALTLGVEIAGALAAAHERSIVHRDIKPSNVMIDARGAVRVLDFGIAHLRARGPRLTATGALLGTPGYMAPEQARGEGTIDARADVFSLGCLLYQALAGRPPFEGDDVMMVLLKVVLDEPEPLAAIVATVPPELDALVAAMLAKTPDERPADGGAVARALRGITGQRSGGAPLSSPPVRVALTVAERRVGCLVVAHPAPDEALPDAELRAAVAEHQGSLDVLADGSVLVELRSSGAGTALAVRAAKCALAVRALLSRATVAVVTGRSEAGEPRAMGPLLSLARTLLSIGDPACVRIDHTTADLCGSDIAVSSDARGLLLRDERAGAAGIGSAAGRLLLGRRVPCVGRDAELFALTSAVDAGIEEPVAQAAIVIGPPGIGKSRVRHEVVRRAKERHPALEVWIARGDPMRAGSPFGLLSQALRGAAEAREGDPAERQRQKLHARIARHVPVGEAARVVTFLAELVGVPWPDGDDVELRAARQSPVLMGDQIRRAFEDFVAAESAAHPLAIVLEDLHWGDRPSVDLIDATLRNLPDRPLFVLALARPEVSVMFPDLWAERRSQTIRLGELPKRAGAEIVRAVLGRDADGAAVTRLVERAAGNAFFLEELIRAHVRAESDALPETVQAVIEARLERLAPEERRALRAASVFGTTFWGAGVATLLGAEVSDVDARLGALVRQEVVARRGPARLAGEVEYVFRHALVRDAAYAMLTEHDARLGHHLAAGWLERAGEQNAAALAEHFERGGEPARAAQLYGRAAEQALEGNDLRAVIELGERAIRCGAAGELLGRTRMLQAEAHRWRGELAVAAGRADEAVLLLPEGSAAFYGALTEAILGHLLVDDRAGFLAHVRRLREPAGTAVGPRAIAVARAAIGLLLTGLRDEARALLEELSSWPPGALDSMAEGWKNRAMATWANFEGTGGAAHLERAVTSFERAGNQRVACATRVNLGYAWMRLGAYDRAESALRGVLDVAARMGLAAVLAPAESNLGMVRAHVGDLDEGLALERSALARFLVQNDTRLIGSARCYTARILLMRGELDEAEAEAERAARGLSGAPPFRALALATLASVLLAKGAPEPARGHAEEAMSTVEGRSGVEEGEALIRLVCAEARLATGDRDAAVRTIASARERLLSLASRLDDAALRETFLLAVPENARTLSLAEEWLGPIRP